MGSVSYTGSGAAWGTAAESETGSGIEADSGIGADSGATSADGCASGSGAGPVPATGAPQLVQNLAPSFSCAPQLVQNMAYPHIVIGSCRDYHMLVSFASPQLYGRKVLIGMRAGHVERANNHLNSSLVMP